MTSSTLFPSVPKHTSLPTSKNQSTIAIWLVLEPTPLKHISQNGNLPQAGMKIKNF